MGSLVNNIANPLDAISFIQNARNTFTQIDQVFRDPEEERRKELRAQQDLALAQLQSQQNLQEQQIAADAASQKQQLTIQAQITEEERQAALRRAVSRQNARFGASGIGSSGGSSNAVLLGLFEESEDEKQRQIELDSLRSTAIDQDVSQTQSINVLQRTQLQQSQDLQNLF